MKHSKHLWRVGLLLILLPILLVTLQQIARPDSFGEQGHYRYTSIDEHRSLPVKHGNREGCVKPCHTKQDAALQLGKHKAIYCETCHFPPTPDHARSQRARLRNKGVKAVKMPTEKHHHLCLTCHGKLKARSLIPSRGKKEFPQIDLKEHLDNHDAKNKGKISGQVCWKCHSQHNPKPKD